MEYAIFNSPAPCDTEVELRGENSEEAGPTPEETEHYLKRAINNENFPLTALKLWKVQKELQAEEGTRTGKNK